MPRSRLACCVPGALCGARLLGVWLAEGVASSATVEREVSQEMLTKGRFFLKVCRFAQEFLILAIVIQAFYLIGACSLANRLLIICGWENDK